jgi:hypothetical protein
MNRRCLLWSAVALLLAVAIDAGLFARALESRAHSVRVGITLAELEAVMGGRA